ncbi:3-hydroxyacyl-CoA dehydrogenase [Novosphingobium hassiacum]|uniref:3-hydroxyacyl-CoA dehydrogenase n=1 Tax=Novosphingobium hassiacum TaxID=173676 RepID=A0A7W6A1T6_9SPHN|nr:3-hydroxyacyl-CoA dehydrogenase NAD-binding domain-containing protein [Novosphingobium hassiacum]MBB3862649.1 3-hydroxyacyl-CoA dehydrogenase [Novosphingobium hassiacum]
MSSVATFEVEGSIGIITVDSPPVNALGINVRRALDEGFKRFSSDAAVEAVVLVCDGRTFFAGADISEFDKPQEGPDLQAVFDLIEGGSKPVVAAIHGTALGGGYELALICHYRIAVPSAKVGLPEVNLGLLPGAGGTQRLPRIVGVPAALDIITGGKPIAANAALELGMIDALAAEGKLREDAIAFARQIVAENRPLLRVRDRNEKLEAAKGDPDLFDAYLAKNARAFKGFKAPGNIVRAVQAAVETAPDFDAGMARETELFIELRDSAESAAQRYYFFAERETAKIPGIAKDTPLLPVKSVGVVGAGTMGGGIAMNFLNIGVPVSLVEMSQEALDRGIGVIRKTYEAAAAKGRMSPDQVEKRLGLITPCIGLETLGEVDLIVEAVFEQMSVKQDIFAKLGAIARPGAILATNTSFLDVNKIAEASGRPEHVVGLHFFAPANVMRLLEVVRGTRTDLSVIATAMKLAKQIGKVPVLSGVCDGFIANRAMRARGDQADQLVLEGTPLEAVDQAACGYGFAMGPFQMMDLVGLDVIGRDSTEQTVMSELVARDRLGLKRNGGYYDYDDKRQGSPSPVAREVIAGLAEARGVPQIPTEGSEEILARLLYPVVNEGARILEEGIAVRASDIDVALITGYNWPVYTGGPMFWADTIGLPKIVAKLKEYEGRFGESFKPAALLEKLAAEGGSFTR